MDKKLHELECHIIFIGGHGPIIIEIDEKAQDYQHW